MTYIWLFFNGYLTGISTVFTSRITWIYKDCLICTSCTATSELYCNKINKFLRLWIIDENSFLEIIRKNKLTLNEQHVKEEAGQSPAKKSNFWFRNFNYWIKFEKLELYFERPHSPSCPWPPFLPQSDFSRQVPDSWLLVKHALFWYLTAEKNGKNDWP